ncbi:hypothetical protein COO60DRAFT_1003280 [Scenedesmus sp. NREL 46B-D3]|nr:hypothetical protein COO60DRAFT_1003280 [Scenedesmus sp. NREL 46B-D3]
MLGAFVPVVDLRKSVLAGCSGPALDKLTAVFRAPSFFLHYDHLGFHTGVEEETWSAGFLLAAPAALQLVTELEQQLSVSLRQARGMISAAEEGKYLGLQAVSIPTDAMYNAILKSFPKLVKQSKSQALYAESRRMLVAATRLAQALPEPSPATALQRSSTPGPAAMFLSLDFEWWERSEDVILEVGWSLWDSLTQQHRTRHWVIKEHLNKANGRFISDNRMRFLFGSSERGSMDKAMAALQAEVDAAGISEGLDRQQKEALAAAGVELVLVGHGMNSDVEIAELYEIEWPQGMQTFDTQRLYMAWQLKQLNAGAAAKALAAVAGGGKGGSKAAAGLDDELQELYNDDSADEEAAGWVDDAMPNEGYEGLAAAASKGMAALSLGKDHRGSPAGSVNSNSGSGANSPGGKAARKGKAQVQNPPRVRPWPAGPAPEDPSRPASSGEQQQQQCDQAVKVERQAMMRALPWRRSWPLQATSPASTPCRHTWTSPRKMPATSARSRPA